MLQSTAGCEFKNAFSNMNVIVLFSMLVWAPLSGWLTDTYANQQHWFLLWCSVAEAAALAAMMVVVSFAGEFDPWAILAIQVPCGVKVHIPGAPARRPLIT